MAAESDSEDENADADSSLDGYAEDTRSSKPPKAEPPSGGQSKPRMGQGEAGGTCLALHACMCLAANECFRGRGRHSFTLVLRQSKQWCLDCPQIGSGVWESIRAANESEAIARLQQPFIMMLKLTSRAVFRICIALWQRSVH